MKLAPANSQRQDSRWLNVGKRFMWPVLHVCSEAVGVYNSKSVPFGFQTTIVFERFIRTRSKREATVHTRVVPSKIGRKAWGQCASIGQTLGIRSVYEKAHCNEKHCRSLIQIKGEKKTTHALIVTTGVLLTFRVSADILKSWYRLGLLSTNLPTDFFKSICL